MLQSSVVVDRDDEAELAFAPLLLALDDGTRYVCVCVFVGGNTICRQRLIAIYTCMLVQRQIV